MRFIDSRKIKKQATSVLAERQEDYRKFVFRHAAVSSALLLILSLIGLLIDRSLADTQGLDGLGTAGLLKSVYMVCMLAGNILLPFWEKGILYTSVRATRRQNTSFSMLSQGFRRFAPLTGHGAMLMLIFFGVGMICFNALIMPFMLLPVPEELQAAMQSLDFTDVAQIEAFRAEYFEDILRYSLPFIIVYTCVYIFFVVLLSYRFRMCTYLLLEDDRPGVMASFGISSRMTRGERKNLFLLDLSFWWYHLATFLISSVVYLPDILLSAGVTLPVSYAAASFIAYIAYVVCHLALIWVAGAYYQTTMACAYETLRTREEHTENEDASDF